MQNQDFNNDNKPKMPKFNMNWLYMIILVALCVMFFTDGGNSLLSGSSGAQKVSYSTFKAYVDRGYANKVVINKTENVLQMYVYGRNVRDVFKKSTKEVGPNPYVEVEIGSVDQVENYLNQKHTEGKFKGDVAYNNEKAGGIMSFLLNVAPLAIFIFIWLFFMGRMGGGGGIGGGVFSVGKSKARVYGKENSVGVTFKDVAGQVGAKQEVQEIVEFLKNPAKYTDLGGKIPKGALLVGPPGTGKTLLAKAVAGEAGVPFFSMSGSDFVEMFVGVGASRVRDTFRQAKEKSPCIIFIDEIDAIGKRRDSQYGGNDEREQTLNQLLAEMDGFDSSKGILILAATNRPEVLDPALLRPGRFDRRVIVDRPDLRGRINILKVHADKVMLDETVDLEEIALATSGAVGSDLANMVNEAAILAVKNGRNAVSQKDLFEAVEVVLVGKEKKDRILSKEERRIVSYHEVGHALISALQKDAEPVQKITIVPRTMGALGYVMQVPEEEKYLNSKNELNAMVIGLLAGRAAEELVFNSITTGAANDIERATKIVRAMITQYGMSDAFGLMGLAQQQDQYLGGRTVLNCGDATATEIDHEVMRVLKEAYEKALEMLAGNRDVLDRIAEFLIQKETITGKEFMALYHQVLEERRRAEDPEYYFDTEDPEDLVDAALPEE